MDLRVALDAASNNSDSVLCVTVGEAVADTGTDGEADAIASTCGVSWRAGSTDGGVVEGFDVETEVEVVAKESSTATLLAAVVHLIKAAVKPFAFRLFGCFDSLLVPPMSL